MAVEDARRREFAEFVADHVLGHHDWNVLHAIVDAEGETDELRQDGRASRPDLNHFLTPGIARNRSRRSRMADARSGVVRAGRPPII